MTSTTEAAPRREPRWGLVDALAAFGFAQIASVIGLIVFATVRDLPADQDLTDALSLSELALLQIPLWFGLLGVPVIATRMRGNGPTRDLGLWMRLRDIPVGIGIGLACQVVLVPLVTLPVFWLTDVDRETLEAPARELTDKATGAGVLVLALVTVVAAPLAEEVFFRGLLQRTLLRTLPVWLGVGITSLAFAASHLQGPQFPALAAFGVVLSILAIRSGRLGPAIWAHVGFNATTIVALLAAG